MGRADQRGRARARLTYGQLIAGLKAAGNPLDRKSLAELAVNEPAAFATLAKPTRRPREGAARASARPRRPPPRSRGGKRRRWRRSLGPIVSCRPLLSAVESTDSRGRVRSRARDAARARRTLRGVRDRYLGARAGCRLALLKSLGQAPAEERPALGKLANELKQDIERALTRACGRERARRAAPARWTSRCPAACRRSATAIR